MAKLRVVIVGGGFAGASVVRALERSGKTEALKVDVIEREQYGAYDRAVLPSLLRGEVRSADIVRHRPNWYAERGIGYHVGTAVHLIDRFGRRVYADQRMLPYDKLILAKGSTPYLPPLRGLLRPDGRLHPGVFALHRLQDAEAISDALPSAPRVAVIGGGPTSLEVVEALCLRGAKVSLVHSAAQLMDGVLDAAAAAILQKRLEALGAEMHLRKRPVAVLGEGQLEAVSFHDGSALSCDLLVVAAGVQPETWLAYQAGLSVERGVVVESRMRSIDDLNVYAIGECAQWRGQIHALPQQITEQAQVVVEHLLDPHSTLRYRGNERSELYQVLGVSVSHVGDPNGRDDDELVQLSQPRRPRHKRVLLRNGRIAGAVLLGDVRQADSLARLYASCAPLSQATREKLFELPLAVASEAPPSVAPPALDGIEQ